MKLSIHIASITDDFIRHLIAGPICMFRLLLCLPANAGCKVDVVLDSCLAHAVKSIFQAMDKQDILVL